LCIRSTNLQGKKKELKQAFEAIHNWIKNSLHKQGYQWALSKDESRQFTIKTTNCLESFNGVLKET